MKKTGILLLSTLCLFLLAACQQGEQQDKTSTDTSRLVKTMVIEADNTGLYRTYPGRVSASQKVDLSFLVSGRLSELPIKEGQQIKKGTVIAQIEPTDYEIRVAQEKAKYDHAKITFGRYAKLLPTEAISKSQYDEKKSIYELAKAHYDGAKKALSDATLYAPFSGLVAKRYVENYQFVQAREKIISLQNITDIEIIINIPEQDIARAEEIERLASHEGDEIIGQAHFDALPGQAFPVTVKEAKTEADPKTQTYRITLLMPFPERGLILPGMTASVRIKFEGGKDDFFVVPVSSVGIDTKGKHFVWIVDMKTMTVKQQDVQAGQITGDQIQILKGLKIGDRIVTAGVAYLNEGMKVRILTGRIGK